MKKSRLLGAVCTCALLLCTLNVHAVTLPLEGRLETTPGSGIYQAYYDPNLDITWAADADINGSDTWDNQVAWAAGLTIDGVGGWRLPIADVNGDGTVVDCFGGGVAGCADNEMGFLFWEEGFASTSPGPFSNVRSGFYWSGTEYASDTTSAWYFHFFGDANQLTNPKGNSLFAWAVHSGDVSAVPVPAAVWLFGSGLLGLVGMGKTRESVINNNRNKRGGLRSFVRRLFCFASHCTSVVGR